MRRVQPGVRRAQRVGLAVLWALVPLAGVGGLACAAQVSSEYASPASQAATRYSGEKLSLNFQNIDVRAVLQVFADFTKLNLVVSDAVTGSVTVRLQDVPWDMALDIILQSKGLGLRRQGTVMMVAPREEWAARDQADLEVRRKISELQAMRTESFQLNYGRAEEVARGLLGSPAAASAAVSASGQSGGTAAARTGPVAPTACPRPASCLLGAA